MTREVEKKVRNEKSHSKRKSLKTTSPAAPETKKRKKSAQEEKEDGTSASLSKNVLGGEDPLSLDHFRLSDGVKLVLRQKGIQSLFPIQAQTFDLALDGRDVVGRAKTGSGKTLAFVLPIVERFIRDGFDRSVGRGPSVLCLTPTRELAKQVCAECEVIGRAANITSCCIYGSSPYFEQERAMRRGIDFLVGTPGRIKDHINRGNLKFTNLKYQILDECDQMLQMGFVEDVEFILNAVGSRSHIQTLLFSATLPPWVKSLLQKFCKPDYETIDLMSTQKCQATNCVQHKCVMVERSSEMEVLPNLIQCHAGGGRTIVFVDTKANCDKVAEALAHSLKARAIHGDLQQKTREMTLDAFRKGQIDVLVATDVAARGLDIPEVALVIQTSPPKDVESYVHRSGRTGRAEKKGVCICLVTRSTEYLVRKIQHMGRVAFEWIRPPQMHDMIHIASEKADEMFRKVKAHKTEMFREHANALLKTWDDPTALVAAALACVSGHAKHRHRSLLLNLDQHVTLSLPLAHGSTVEECSRVIQGRLGEGQSPKGMKLIESGNGVVFDVHEDQVAHYLEAFPQGNEMHVEIVTSLPRLKASPRQHYCHGNFRNGNSYTPFRGHHHRQGGRSSHNGFGMRQGDARRDSGRFQKRNY